MNTRTLASTVRCDARSAAMALKLLDSQGVKVVSVADLFRETIEVLAELAISNGLIERIDSTVEAVNYLRDMKIVDLTDNSRLGRGAVVKAIRREQQQLAIPSRSVPHYEPPPVQVPSSIPDIDYEELRKRAEQREREEREKMQGLSYVPTEAIEGEE